MKTELLRRQFEATLNFSPSREPRKITREKREKNCEFLRFFYVENGEITRENSQMVSERRWDAVDVSDVNMNTNTTKQVFSFNPKNCKN